MSTTAYYLQSIPEDSLKFEVSKKIRTSLISDHKLDLLLDILTYCKEIEDETVEVINKGVRGPYSDGYYCGFRFDDEFVFWKTLVEKYPQNGMLNLIFAEYLVQKEKGYFTAHQFYKKAFETDYRLIFSIEPSWRDELLEQDFEYEIFYLRTQKDNYEKDDFEELMTNIKLKYRDDKVKIDRIDQINCTQ